MQWDLSYILWVGTAVALLGFCKWPKSSYELIHPRFVVPAIIWLSTFGQAMLIRTDESGPRIYESARIEYGLDALWYTILSILCFYIGLMIPVGQRFASPLMRIEDNVNVNLHLLRKAGWAGTWILAFLFLLLAGPAALGISSVGSLIPMTELVAKVAAIIFSVGSVFNAAMLGLTWPEKEERTPLVYVTTFIGLAINSMYTMPVFGRGAGLPVFVAALAYSIRVKRMSLLVMVPSVIWVALCANTGLYGRGVFGRQSNVPTYLYALVNYSLFDPVNVFRSGFGLNDCFTSLAMSMKAINRTYVGQMSQLDWLIFQIPIPHWFSFLPAWTVDLTIFIGGRGTWGYTTGILGDTFIHWGWLGAGWFIVVGVAYRFVATLAFRQDQANARSVSAFSMMLFTGYFAWGVGIFNSFRAWVVAFTFPALLVLGFVMLLSLFFVSPKSEQAQYPAELPYDELPPQQGARHWV